MKEILYPPVLTLGQDGKPEKPKGGKPKGDKPKEQEGQPPAEKPDEDQTAENPEDKGKEEDKDKENGEKPVFDPEKQEDQKSDDWYYHWHDAPHKKRGGKPHWDRGNLHNGEQQWSPDGHNWNPK